MLMLIMLKIYLLPYIDFHIPFVLLLLELQVKICIKINT